MTVPASYAAISYNGSGSTGPFAITWPFIADSHVVVKKTVAAVESTLVLDDDYTLTGANTDEGGELTLDVALETGETIEITRSVPVSQLVDYLRNDPFPAQTTERGLDKLTMICQELAAEIEVLQENEGNIDLDVLIQAFIDNQDFIDLLTQLITNIYDYGDQVLELGPLSYLIPLFSISGTTGTVNRTNNAGLVSCTNALPTTVTIRENTGSDTLDWRNGSFVSFRQTTVGGQITLAEDTGMADFEVPFGFLPKTRCIGAKITAVCLSASEGGSVWSISGDLAIDPASSTGQAVNDLTSSSGVVNIDWSLGRFFRLTPTENITSFTHSNVPDSGYAQEILVRFIQHASSAKTVSFTGFKTVAGAAVSSGTSKRDLIKISTFDQGTTYLLTITNDLS